MSEKADYRGKWKGSALLELGKDTSTITKALISDLRLTSMNLLAYGAMDKAVAKDKDDLMNMLTSIESLDSFSIKYSRIDGTLKISVEGKIAIYLPKTTKKKTRKKK